MKNLIHRILCKGKFILLTKVYRPFKKDDWSGDQYEITTFITQCDTCGQINEHTSYGKELIT